VSAAEASRAARSENALGCTTMSSAAWSLPSCLMAMASALLSLSMAPLGGARRQSPAPVSWRERRYLCMSPTRQLSPASDAEMVFSSTCTKCAGVTRSPSRVSRCNM
jgi:hypothetical protein